MSRAVERGFARTRRARVSGFSLVEALVAVLVLAVGLLGVAALQMNTLRNNQGSLQRTQAVTLIYFMFDTMRANRADAEDGHYDIGKTCTVPAAGTSLVSQDRHFWLQALKDNIGDLATTCGQISCPAGAATCTVGVFWKDNRDASGPEEHFEVSTRL